MSSHIVNRNEKKTCDAYILGVSPLGFFGAHHFYLGRVGWGVLYLCTFGMLGVGYLIDCFRIPILVKRVNNPHVSPQYKYIDDAFVAAFPLGFLGLHHFYLRRYVWFVLYLCTFGLFGIGWLIDLVRLPWLVKDYNMRYAGGLVVEEQPPGMLRPPATTVIVTSHPAGQPIMTSHQPGYVIAPPAGQYGATQYPPQQHMGYAPEAPPPYYSAGPNVPSYQTEHHSSGETKQPLH